MRNKLAVEMKQKVDDEDDRLAKAVAERDDKVAKEEQAKQEREFLTRKSIHQHRIDRVRYHFVCREIFNNSDAVLKPDSTDFRKFQTMTSPYLHFNLLKHYSYSMNADKEE